jgi:hypothetical protein
MYLEDTVLLGYEAATMGNLFLVFRRKFFKGLEFREECGHVGPLDHWRGRNCVPLNITTRSTSNVSHRPRRTDSSATQLWRRQDSPQSTSYIGESNRGKNEKVFVRSFAWINEKSLNSITLVHFGKLYRLFRKKTINSYEMKFRIL